MNTPEERILHVTVMDDESRQIARVYADALFKAAGGDAEGVLGELEAIVQGVFGKDPGLALFFESASINRERKQTVLDRAFSSASDTVRNFLGVLNNHGRLPLLRGIVQALRALYEQKNRRVVVHVCSAVPLNDDERRRVSEDVRSVANVEPILHEYVDPDILGGLIIRVRDWVYDASVRTRLETMRNQLIERSSHVITERR